jgi:adenosylcobinamide kinase/adenosylcobinamide-phosphate guanylyltransferase
MRELILSGGKSGKPRCAESRAKDWLQVSARHALLIATAMPGDPEMCERIARHREQRALPCTKQLAPGCWCPTRSA